MPVISLITPVHAPAAQYLAAAHQSLVAQDLPAGWSWEWVIQQDGDDYELDDVPVDERIRFSAGRRGGPGVARTLALARVTGSLVKVLDADDQLAPGALARDIDVLTQNPAIGWTTSRVLDLLPTGETVGFDADPPAGRLERGSVHRHWLAHDWRAQVHPATLCIRYEQLLALGGWMALPASEDTGLLLAANAIWPGWFIPETGLLYRKWEGQITAHLSHASDDERGARMHVIHERVLALQHLLSPGV
jgi:glycosyltransferase involved in cell wall biosynthesis